MLLKPDTAYGQCITPMNKSTIDWRGVAPTREAYESIKNLPPVEKVWESVFTRRGRQKDVEEGKTSLSFWFVSFVNWFHDDNFRTERDSDGTYTWSDQLGLRLSQVYGHTAERQEALRAGDRGKMKTQTIGDWDHFPPSLLEIQSKFPGFEMWTPQRGPLGNNAAVNGSQTDLQFYFAIGDPRFNMHPGHIMWASIALYIHNSACEAIYTSNPELSDEEIFQRARVILFHAVQATRLNHFVLDSVSNTRDHFQLHYDPPSLRDNIGTYLNFKGGTPNYIEFNHIYQAWHSFVPDALRFKEVVVPMRNLMWTPKLFHEESISSIAASFVETPAAEYGPHSFLPFLKNITIQALKDERSQRMQSYNAYRVMLGLAPLTSFDQLGLDNPDEVAELYRYDIDNLELLPGILADNKATLPENLVGDMQLILVALLAVEDIVSSDIISNPQLWSEDYLTKGGMGFLKEFDFSTVLTSLLNGTRSTPSCTFRTSDEGCTPRTKWVNYQQVPSCFLCMPSVRSYLAMDIVDWFYDDNGYMRDFVITITLSFVFICLLSLVLYRLTQAMFLNRKESSLSSVASSLHPGILQIVVLALNTVVALVLCIPATWFWTQLISTPYWIKTLEKSSYHVVFLMTSLLGTAFAAEIALRLSKGSLSMSTIVIHHLGFYYLQTVALSTADIFVFKFGTTMAWAFSWEWPLYMSFLVLRCCDLRFKTTKNPSATEAQHRKFVQYGLPFFIAIYFLTRFIETVFLLQLLVCGGRRYMAENSVDSTPFFLVLPIAPILLVFQYHAGWVLAKVRRKRLTQDMPSSID